LFQQGFESVLLAGGGWDSRMARGGVSEIESPIPGTYMMVDLLGAAAEGTDGFSCSSDVVIFGGGKLALEAVKACKRFDAHRITILFRENWENSPVTDAEVKDLGVDGVNIVYSTGISCLRGEADGLKELEYIDTDSLQKVALPAQTLIIASGRFPELIFVESKPNEVEPEEPLDQPLQWEAIPPYKQPAFKDEIGLFADGDALADYSAAIRAIGAGRRAAVSIQQLLYGLDPSLTEHVITPQSVIQDVDHVEKVAASRRQIMPICSGRELVECGEIERGFSDDKARDEASRCLQCGLICYERHEKPQLQQETA